ncbi:hypothetical protein [Variovorax paradoxus]|uniref:hypothetical protein n=1 Tax=Variovorax paradoxus TaxID=34073 RepID=UPI003D64FA75
MNVKLRQLRENVDAGEYASDDLKVNFHPDISMYSLAVELGCPLVADCGYTSPRPTAMAIW